MERWSGYQSEVGKEVVIVCVPFQTSSDDVFHELADARSETVGPDILDCEFLARLGDESHARVFSQLQEFAGVPARVEEQSEGNDVGASRFRRSSLEMRFGPGVEVVRSL